MTAKGYCGLGLSIFLIQGTSLLSSSAFLSLVTTIATKIDYILPWPSLIILQGVFFDVRSLILGDLGWSVRKGLLLLTVMVFKFSQGQDMKQNWRVVTHTERNSAEFESEQVTTVCPLGGQLFILQLFKNISSTNKCCLPSLSWCFKSYYKQILFLADQIKLFGMCYFFHIQNLTAFFKYFVLN